MRLVIVAAVLSAVASGTAGSESVLYVSIQAPLGGNGLTWDTPFKHLQDALWAAAAIAEPRDVEIHVGQGIYWPDLDEAGNVTVLNRYETFTMLNGVRLMGGYAGYGAPDPEERYISSYETTLSGDLLGDDDGFVNNDENSLHVVSSGTTDATAILDGFTVKAGNADIAAGVDGSGGGLTVLEDASPLIRDCSFMYNQGNRGGAIHTADGSTPTITGCLFFRNHGVGGGMLTRGGATIEDSNFFENIGVHYYGGGGIYSGGSAPTIITSCSFVDNYTEGTAYGAGIRAGADTIVTNCLFRGNVASSGGGIFTAGSDVVVTNCTFYDNHAPTHNGGGICLQSINPIVRNCIFWSNTPDQISDASGSETVSHCCVQDGYPGDGNIDRDPLFANPAFDNLTLSPGSPCIDAGNNDAEGLVGITTDLDGAPRFHDDRGMPDTGVGTPPIVDMGAYEFQGETPTCPWDCEDEPDGSVGIDDLVAVINHWGVCADPGNCPWDCQETPDGNVGIDDLVAVINHWGPCP